MPKGLRRTVREHLEKCRAAAIAAVDAYNRPGPRFRTAQYVILVVIAWSAFFHAVFYRRGRRPWYTKKKDSKSAKGTRYVKIDGEPKHWELSECLRQYYGEANPPERRNLEFLLGLRNKIEHRHLPDLDPTLYGECQAALMNLEQALTGEFGATHGLQEQLVIALQFSSLVPEEKRKALKTAASKASKTVTDYIERFRSALPPATLTSMNYSFSVFLVPKVTGRATTADYSVRFVKVDEANKEELERLERLNVLIREKHIPIANLNFRRPSEVVALVQEKVPHAFTMTLHTVAWHYYKVRPPAGDEHPERTLEQYCIWDRAHGDYLYTEAWVQKLVAEFGDPVRYRVIVGGDPYPK